jgi:hypothetical protein
MRPLWPFFTSFLFVNFLVKGSGQGKSELSKALIDAARGGHHEVVKLLLKHGAGNFSFLYIIF